MITILTILISLGYQPNLPVPPVVVPIIEIIEEKTTSLEPIRKVKKVVVDTSIVENHLLDDTKKVEPEITKNQYGWFQRWNEQAQCYDESEFPSFETIYPIYDETGYASNWLSCEVFKNGCLFCFHPNQGHGNNNFDDKYEKKD